MKRILLISLGIFATGLGILGVILPGLPTTIFLIIALWAFSQSSERLTHWLSNVPILKHAMVHVHHYNKHKAVSKHIKIISQVAAWCSFTFFFLIHAPLLILIPSFICAVSCSVAMYMIKTTDAKE